MRDAFAEVGFDDARLAETSDGSLAVLGNRPGPAGRPPSLLYSHYDVMPAPDEDAWHSPPFTLTERDGRWYGRGAADCRGTSSPSSPPCARCTHAAPTCPCT